MNSIDYIIKQKIKRLLEQQTSRELDNAKSDSGNLSVTPAEKKFLGKFDAYGVNTLGVIYSISDTGIREFIARSGISLNITTQVLLQLLRKKYIKIVPYTGYGRNTDYTIELQLSLDSIKGWGTDEQDAAEKKQPAAGGGSTDTAGPDSSGAPVPPPAE